MMNRVKRHRIVVGRLRLDHDGLLSSMRVRYLIPDRDSKFTEAFDQFLRDSGVEPIILPRWSPNLNAYCERFVRSAKEEALNRMIVMGEASLRYALNQYISHYHAERNHQGLDHQPIAPESEVGGQTGQVKRRERLGGILVTIIEGPRDLALYTSNHQYFR